MTIKRSIVKGPSVLEVSRIRRLRDVAAASMDRWSGCAAALWFTWRALLRTDAEVAGTGFQDKVRERARQVRRRDVGWGLSWGDPCRTAFAPHR
jgi:hypothetical protein